MILHVDVKPVLAGDGGRGYVFRESEVAASAEASACRRAKGNSVQKQPLVEAVAKQVIDFEVERQSYGRDRIGQQELNREECGTALAAGRARVWTDPQPFGEIIAAAVPV